MMFRSTLTALALTFALSPSVSAQDLLIKNAKIVTNSTQGTLENADILIRNGRITNIGADIQVDADIRTIQTEGSWVTPGLFAAISQVGLVDIGAESSTNDTRSAESDTSVSESATDSFNPKAVAIANTRIEGITHAVVSSSPAGHSIFSGTGLIADMSGSFDSVIESDAFIFVQLGSRGANIAGGSRSAALQQLRAALDDAGAYPSRFGSPDDGDALSRQDAAALAQAVRGRIPLLIGADRAIDLLNIINLKKEYRSLDIIIVGAAEGWMVAEQLAAANMKVMIDPHANLPGSFDTINARQDNAVLLSDAGVEMAFTTQTAGLTHNIRVLPQHAGNAVGNGLSWDKAFAAVSSVPAKWFGVRSEIRTGAQAGLVVWDGDPLEVTSSPALILINGEEQSLSSRQTALRDRYNPTNSDARPHKYR